MNCKCIVELEAQVNELDYKGGVISNAQLEEKTITFANSRMSTVTFSTFEFNVEGLKGKKKRVMLHSFCPFCGIKI